MGRLGGFELAAAAAEIDHLKGGRTRPSGPDEGVAVRMSAPRVGEARLIRVRPAAKRGTPSQFWRKAAGEILEVIAHERIYDWGSSVACCNDCARSGGEENTGMSYPLRVGLFGTGLKHTGASSMASRLD